MNRKHPFKVSDPERVFQNWPQPAELELSFGGVSVPLQICQLGQHGTRHVLNVAEVENDLGKPVIGKNAFQLAANFVDRDRRIHELRIDKPDDGDSLLVVNADMLELRFGHRKFSRRNPSERPHALRPSINLTTIERKFYGMSDKSVAVIVTITFSILGVAGDFLLKLASSAEHPLKTRWFYLGFAVYASTALGWVFVMRHLKLGTIGVVYAVSMIVLLTVIGVVVFREPLSRYEFLGIAMAVGSLFLLIRFA